MSKSSGSAAIGTVVTVVGALLAVTALTSSNFGSLLPGAMLVWLGLSIRARATKQNARPRVPEGFAPARPEVSAAESPTAGQPAPGDRLPEGSGTEADGSPVMPTGFPHGIRDEQPTVPPPTPSATTARPLPDPAPPRPESGPPINRSGRPSPTGDGPRTDESTDDVPVSPEVRAQVVELARSGRTVEAIEVLREATGMELYEASQYVRGAREQRD